MYFLYIIACADNTLYTGVTTNLERRVLEHNTSKKGAKYTSSRRPVQLVFSKKFKTRSLAQIAEAVMKKLPRAAKLLIIQKYETKCRLN